MQNSEQDRGAGGSPELREQDRGAGDAELGTGQGCRRCRTEEQDRGAGDAELGTGQGCRRFRCSVPPMSGQRKKKKKKKNGEGALYSEQPVFQHPKQYST